MAMCLERSGTQNVRQVPKLEMRCHCYLGDEKEQLKVEAESLWKKDEEV